MHGSKPENCWNCFLRNFRKLLTLRQGRHGPLDRDLGKLIGQIYAQQPERLFGQRATIAIQLDRANSKHNDHNGAESIIGPPLYTIFSKSAAEFLSAWCKPVRTVSLPSLLNFRTTKSIPLETTCRVMKGSRVAAFRPNSCSAKVRASSPFSE